MPEKPVVTTTNRLFLVLGATVQNQQNQRLNVAQGYLVVVLRPGRPEVRILPVAPRKDLGIVHRGLFYHRFLLRAVEKRRITSCGVVRLFLFYLSFKRTSSVASVYCPFASFSFLSLFTVARMRRNSSGEKLALLSAGRKLIFSIRLPDSCVLCPRFLS